MIILNRTIAASSLGITNHRSCHCFLLNFNSELTENNNLSLCYSAKEVEVMGDLTFLTISKSIVYLEYKMF